MPHQLHFWIGDDLKEILQDYADTRHLSIAAAVRVLLYQALTDKKDSDDQPSKLRICGQRSPCTCDEDCGARPGEFTGNHCPQAIGYLDWLRSEGYPEDRLERTRRRGASDIPFSLIR